MFEYHPSPPPTGVCIHVVAPKAYHFKIVFLDHVSGILLMGFKPASAVRKFCQTKPANFIYPDDKVRRSYS